MSDGKLPRKDWHKDSEYDCIERLADFFNEAGMLRHIARSGFAFLGSGGESVAEHTFRVCIIGYALARMTGADAAQVTFMCLFHDLHEARTGDFNYVNHRYNNADSRRALEDACTGTGLEKDILFYWDKLEEGNSFEAQLANDADQLDLICNLREQQHKGNDFATDWLESALKRLQTNAGKTMGNAILKCDPNHWWFGRIEKDWWINHGKKSCSND